MFCTISRCLPQLKTLSLCKDNLEMFQIASWGLTLTPHTGNIALDTLRYGIDETVQRSGGFQNRQCKLYKAAGEVIFEEVKDKVSNKTIP